jgi:hypothetical protein
MAASNPKSPWQQGRGRRSLLGREGMKLLAGVVLITAVLFGQYLVGLATAGSRLDAALAGASGPRDIIVILDFTPERFHSERLAQYGVFAGRDRAVNRIRLRMVSPENLQRLANLVWIARIQPLR